MKAEYKKGAEARKSFEEGMKKLFRVPKSAVKPKPKTPKGAKKSAPSAQLWVLVHYSNHDEELAQATYPDGFDGSRAAFESLRGLLYQRQLVRA